MRLLFFIVCTLLFITPAYAAKDKCTDTLPENYQPILERLAAGTSQSLLYRLERCKYPESYVFGTFHSDSPTLKPILDQALKALDKSTRLVLEIIVTPKSQIKTLKTMMLQNGHPGLHTLIPRPLFDTAVVKLGPILNQNADMINRYTPWGLALIVQYPSPEDDGVVLDQKLQEAAQSKGKRVYAVETIEEQLTLFTSLSPLEQQGFLEATLQQINTMDAMFKELNSYYLAQDLAAIERMSDRMFDEMAVRHPALTKKLKAGLIDNRNKLMLKRALTHLDQPTLIAVGALHLPGETGLLHAFESEGFAVYPVINKPKKQD